MAQQGMLVAGQTIAVSKYNVQVERYLSQGGFAHVYLVRTPEPVYGTTHHVLKRIAVPNEVMLAEVKKEVDIMRILKGHPNIVHLIDAAWHQMPNGTFEVFILMEFCQGGGIIDMMNRRLRERLTEPEILQIFVDVCEGVAAMHNLRPALLHRDLKVENILQASPTSFKLCDFGSATPVSRPPSNTAEIRMLEADLNRHTTLQYRAPEMIDLFLKRPVDEKSDVWALGVLLYKLCYYTTPFEEHGPLAILNVQYRIPPYPVYSNHMNALIDSMLKEHGTQRPTVFEILTRVHALRGTKSRFAYNRPPTQQPSAPLPIRSPETNPSSAANANPLDSVVSYRSSSKPAPAPVSAGAGAQARDRVLEAIAPMRRGRPENHASPSKTPDIAAPSVRDDDFESQWKSTTAKHQQASLSPAGPNTNDVWRPRSPLPSSNVGSAGLAKKSPTGNAAVSGFADDFSKQAWDSHSRPTDSTNDRRPTMPPRDSDKPTSKPISIPSSNNPNRLSVPLKGRDAFDGLGLSPSQRPQAPTLGEARKLRTGLASISSPVLSPSPSSSQSPALPPRPKPTPSPRPPSSPMPAQKPPPSPVPGLGASQRQQVGSPWLDAGADAAAESRFPTLEELDATFSGVGGHVRASPALPSRGVGASQSQPVVRAQLSGATSKPAHLAAPSGKNPGVRSQQVTGVAMRASQQQQQSQSTGSRQAASSPAPTSSSRPALARKHKSSTNLKNAPANASAAAVESVDLLSFDAKPPSRISPVPTSSSRAQTQDWLTDTPVEQHVGSTTTGAHPSSNSGPVLKDPRSRRNSYVDSMGVVANAPQAQSAVVVVDGAAFTPSDPPRPSKPKSKSSLVDVKAATPHTTGSGGASNRQEYQLTENWSPVESHHPPTSTAPPTSSSSSSQREREQQRARAASRTSGAVSVSTRDRSSSRPRSRVSSRAPSAAAPTPVTVKATKLSSSGSSSSSAEEGPEDATGSKPPSGVPASAGRKDYTARRHQHQQHQQQQQQSQQHNKGKGRQNSVHDLVDLWSGSGGSHNSHSTGNSITSAASREPERDKKPSVLPSSRSRFINDVSPSAVARENAVVAGRDAPPSILDRDPPLIQEKTSSSRRGTTGALGSASTQVMSPPASTPSAGPPPILSPKPTMSTTVSSTTTGSAKPYPAKAVKPSTPGRKSERPQSMIVFPITKTNSEPSPSPRMAAAAAAAEEAGLKAPPSLNPVRAGRRTSITDMVQRYEAIGVVGGATGSPASPAANSASGASTGTGGASHAPRLPPKPAGTRVAPQSRDGVNSHGTGSGASDMAPSRPRTSGSSSIIDSSIVPEGTGGGDYTQQPIRRSPTANPTSTTPSGLPPSTTSASPVKGSFTGNVPYPGLPSSSRAGAFKLPGLAPEVTALPPRAATAHHTYTSHPSTPMQGIRLPGLAAENPRITAGRHNTGSSIHGNGNGSAGSPAAVTTKPTVSPTAALSRASPTEMAPPSPMSATSSSSEQTYQGVGKLISQWQRKTAEAAATATGPGGRGTSTPLAKRTGLVGGKPQ